MQLHAWCFSLGHENDILHVVTETSAWVPKLSPRSLEKFQPTQPSEDISKKEILDVISHQDNRLIC